MVFGIIVICGVLIALQFPVVMSSPLTALGFAALITCALGTVAAVVGGTVAPLPLFALVLVSENGIHTTVSLILYSYRQQKHSYRPSAIEMGVARISLYANESEM